MPGVEISWDNPACLFALSLSHSLSHIRTPLLYTHTFCYNVLCIYCTVRKYSVHMFTAQCSFLHLHMHTYTNYRKMEFSVSPTTTITHYLGLENYGYRLFVLLFWQQPRVAHFLIPLIPTLGVPTLWEGTHEGAGTVSPSAEAQEEGLLQAGTAGENRLQPGEGLARPLGQAGRRHASSRHDVHLSVLQLELQLFRYLCHPHVRKYLLSVTQTLEKYKPGLLTWTLKALFK